ncbi:MAG TPA: PilZ domain-containing protein [Candidatus Dormibacteraeota bacterium]|nr:PilZ domain-containing protein [Candidatus Dormibacteraeota bacterium]
MATLKERKYRRYSFQCGVHLQFRTAGGTSQLDGVTKNVSMGGMLMESASLIPESVPVIFTMTIAGGQVTSTIVLRGEGEVIRVEPVVADRGFAIALKFARPIEWHRV